MRKVGLAKKGLNTIFKHTAQEPHCSPNPSHPHKEILIALLFVSLKEESCLCKKHLRNRRAPCKTTTKHN